MKSSLHIATFRRLFAYGLSFSLAVNALPAQEEEEKDIFELSPFVVESTAQGYYDSSTLAGTRLKGQVRDVGAAIQILTSEFMEDIDADSVNDLLLYTTSSEASGLGGNFTGSFATQGMGVNVQNTQNEPHRALRIRGIAPPDLTRDFFITDIPMDRYNTDRVTVNRGANSILFGLGSPAGIVNNTLKKAELGRDSYQVQARIGNSGTGEDISWRVMGDFNVVVVDDKLAVRLALLEDEQNYMQQPAFKRDSRHYLTATARPFKGTTIRAFWEKGDVDANNPDPTGPYENISRYLEARDLIHEANGDNTIPLVGDSYAWGVREEGKTRYIWEGTPANGIIRTPNLFKTLTFIWDPTSKSVAYGIQPNIPGNRFRNATPLPGLTPPPGNARNSQMKSVENVGRTNEIDGYNYQGLTDLEFFDFAEHLIGGYNGFQNREFETYNFTLEQLFLDGDLGIEVAYDHQEYFRESFNPYRGQYTPIRVDFNETLPDGRPNPNLGRPYVLSRSQVNLADNTTEREVFRATAFYKLNFDKIFDEDSRLAGILGEHVFTGFYNSQEINARSISEAEGFFGPDDLYLDDIFGTVRFPRTTTIISYIGPAVDLYSNPAGLMMSDWSLDLDLIRANDQLLAPGTTVDNVAFLHEKRDPLAMEIHTINRENYVQDARLERTEIDSYSFVWQSFLLNRHIVPTLGWRKDEVATFIRNADPSERGIDYVIDPEFFNLNDVEPSIDEDTIFSWGIVAYWPRSIVKLPEGTDISFHYNTSENFIPDPGRIDQWGENLPAPNGETEDYGVTVSMFDNKLVAKLNWFESSQNNSNNPRVGNIFRSSIYQMSEIVIHEALEDIYDYESDPNPDPEFFPNIEATYAALAEMQEFYGFSIDYDNAELVLDPNVRNSQILDVSRAYLRTDTSDVVNGIELPYVGELQDTQDITAEGFEFELTYNPKPNWRIMMNIAEIKSVTSNSAPRLGEWIDELGPIVSNPNGIGALSRGNPAGPLEEGEETMGEWWITNIVNSANAIQAYDGLPTPELRRWRVNFTTNYNFRDGRLKGWGIGGSLRWQDKVTIGNQLLVAEDGSLVPDVNNPYWGPDQTNVDLFFSYSRKIFNNKVNWRLQFNIRNVFFDKHDLIPIVAQPDGSIAEVRVSPPRVFSLTSTFRW